MQTASTNTPETLQLPIVSIAEAQAEAMTQADYAKAFTVSTASDSVAAQLARGKINTRIKELTEQRMSITRKIDAAKEGIMDLFRGPIGLLETAKRMLDSKVLAFDAEQEQIRKEAQRKVEADAQKERARLQAIADETARKAREEADAKRKLAEEAAAAGRAEEAAKLNAQAERTEERAAAKVDSFTTRAASVVAPIIQSESAKATGSSFRDNWKWRLKDKAKVNPAFLMTVTNDAAIDAIVKSMKGNAESITAVVGDGIEIYNDRGLASRRA